MKLSELQSGDFADGVWKDIYEFPGVSVKVRSSEHQDYQRSFTAALRPHRRAINEGHVDPMLLRRLTNECVVKHLILDWKGVDDDDGNPIPFSKDVALPMAKDRIYNRFFKAIERAADAVASGEVEEREEVGEA